MVSSMLPDEVETHHLQVQYGHDSYPYCLQQAEESQPALYKILDDNVANPFGAYCRNGTVSISVPPMRSMYIATPINWMPTTSQ